MFRRKKKVKHDSPELDFLIAITKAIPRSPKDISMLPFTKPEQHILSGRCPSCEKSITNERQWCIFCGQTIDWSDGK